MEKQIEGSMKKLDLWGKEIEEAKDKEKSPVGESSGVRKMEKESEDQKRSGVPNDLTKIIVKKLLLKSAARLCTVSRNWLAMISQKNYAQESNPASILFTFSRIIPVSDDPNVLYRRFYWTSMSEMLDDDEEITFRSCQIENPDVSFVCPPVRGLVICYSSDVLVCNPALGTFLALPSLPPILRPQTICYFGFDPIGESFKVLAVREEVENVHGHIQVLTLCDEKPAWRPIRCNYPPHSPFTCVRDVGDEIHHTHGVYIEDKIFYGANLKNPKEGEHAAVVMMFDLHSEKLTLIPLPELVKPDLLKHRLVKFKDQLAVVPDRLSDDYFYLWVLVDYHTPSWSYLTFYTFGENAQHFVLKGTCSDSEFLSAQDFVVDRAVELMCYDSNDFSVTRISVKEVEPQVNDYDGDDFVEMFLDYVEEPLLLPGGSEKIIREMIGKHQLGVEKTGNIASSSK